MASALTSLPEPDLLEFADDCLKHLRGIQIPFLSKYRDRFGGNSLQIAPAREYTIDVMQKALRHTRSDTPLDSFKQELGEVNEVLAAVIFARR